LPKRRTTQAQQMSDEHRKKPLLPSDTQPPTRLLLPQDVTEQELWWLYHNHLPLHQFIERIITEAELAWQRHHNWERSK
jgi:hypothetical protein